MDNILSAAILGLMQGLTEFLPISSTAHLILMQKLLEFKAPPHKIFEVIVQIGSALAVLTVYWERLIFSLKGDRPFLAKIAVATVPAALIGFLFHSPIKTLLYNHITIGLSLILGGLFFLLIDRIKQHPSCNAPETIHPKQATLIGAAQAVALIPGVSRSGATIAAGVLVGMSASAATQFSFMLAIPTLLGAGCYELFSNWHAITAEHATTLSIGFLTSFVASLLVFRPLVQGIDRYGFRPFGWYRIGLGILLLLPDW